ncbi:redoxin domain-containing protein [Lacinutrix iliipiscaria]|uniref:Redoxin domain-containing protein n=1 Tax=Lacinutrix iliipiscaria TaxID=1230532 RepID=A0ABW5WL86_9FLAO
MKKLIMTLSAITTLIACKEEPKDYMTFSGTIIDKNSDSIVVSNKTYSKTIKVNEDGTFSDTLKIESGRYSFYDGGESTSLYLQNGFDLNMTLDTKMFDETIVYAGLGSETNNYLAKKSLMEETLFPPSLFDFEEADFKAAISEISAKKSEFLNNNKNIDSTLYASEMESLNQFESQYLEYYAKQEERNKARAAKFADLIGQPSPTFENYENFNGGDTSLNDLKGKYVYVDVWATWCGPCKAEIPSLKAVEKEYHDKNIEFVSISVDNGRGYKNKSQELAYEGWKKMIADKEMGGVQLFADNAFQSDFITGYKINSIPRFILIGPDGIIINPDAPRPSSPKLKKLFNSLNI